MNRSLLKDKVLCTLGNKTIEEVLHSLGRSRSIYKDMIFVIDNEGVFIGVVRLSDISLVNRSEVLYNYLKKDHPTAISDMSHEAIVNLALRKSVTSVPVLDKDRVLIDVILPDEIMRILRKEHIEDIHKLAGIKKESSLAREALEAPPFRRAGHRLPWLIAGLGGSIIATGIMTKFEYILSENIAVSFFIPGIVYLADAVGTQTEAISVRGLSLSDVSFKKLFFREMRTGFVIGAILGLLCFPIISILFTIDLAIAVSLSVLVAGTVAASIGLLFPWVLSKFKIDPAFGSGPIATIIQDILSILIYFLIILAMLYLEKLNFSIYTFF